MQRRRLAAYYLQHILHRRHLYYSCLWVRVCHAGCGGVANLVVVAWLIQLRAVLAASLGLCWAIKRKCVGSFCVGFLCLLGRLDTFLRL